VKLKPDIYIPAHKNSRTTIYP